MGRAAVLVSIVWLSVGISCRLKIRAGKIMAANFSTVRREQGFVIQVPLAMEYGGTMYHANEMRLWSDEKNVRSYLRRSQ
jgi:hypothetical protein